MEEKYRSVCKRLDGVERALMEVATRLDVVLETSSALSPSDREIAKLAIRKLQTVLDADIDGLVGPKTIKALRRHNLTWGI